MSNVSETASTRAGVALIVSNDTSAIEPLAAAMQQLAINPELCTDIGSAKSLLNSRKFEAVLVDLQFGDDALRVLEAVRNSRSNRTAVTFTISRGEGELSDAFKAGSHFVLRRPLAIDSTLHMLKVAYGLIVRERRRYFRYSITFPVSLRPKDLPELEGESVNISGGGIAVRIPSLLPPGVRSEVRFVLPSFDSVFCAESVVCWQEKHNIGLQFLSLSPQQVSELQEWLAMRLEENLPASVVEKFRSG